MKTILESLWRFAAATLLALSLAACIAIPKQNLDVYVASFNTAKATAEDIYLTAQVQAEKAGGNSNVNAVLRAQRIETVQARLAALDVIAQYNTVLVKLATGTDPADVKDNLEGLSKSLASFGSRSLSALVTDVVPFFGVISQGIALIDNAIKARKFAEAAASGLKPIQDIIGILVRDADNLHGIQRHVLEIPVDQEIGNLTKLYNRSRLFVNGVNADSDVTGLVTGFNASLASLSTDAIAIIKPPLVVHAPASGAKLATAGDIALLHALLNQSNAIVESSNQASKKILSHKKLIEEYKTALRVCSSSLEELNTAVRDGTRVATLAFVANVINLRKAFIEVREAK